VISKKSSIGDSLTAIKREMELTGSGKQAVEEEPNTSVVYSTTAKV
jgi:hypothetical protein